MKCQGLCKFKFGDYRYYDKNREKLLKNGKKSAILKVVNM